MKSLLQKLKKFKVIIGIAISVFIFYAIFSRISKDWETTKESLSSANWWEFVIAVILIFIGEMFVVLMWKFNMRYIYNKRISFFQAFIMMFMPNVARYLPGKVWFVFGISYLAKRWNLNTIASLVITLITQIMILLTALMNGLIFSQALNKGNLFSIQGIIVVILMLILVIKPDILHKMLILVLKLVGQNPEEIDIPKMPIWLIGLNLVLGLLLWTFIGIGMTVSAKAISPQVSWHDMWNISGAFSFSYFAAYVSFITPAGLGVREGVFSALLPKTIPDTQRLVISVGSRLWMTFAELLIFAIGAVMLKFTLKENYAARPPHSDGVPKE